MWNAVLRVVTNSDRLYALDNVRPLYASSSILKSRVNQNHGYMYFSFIG